MSDDLTIELGIDGLAGLKDPLFHVQQICIAALQAHGLDVQSVYSYRQMPPECPMLAEGGLT